MGLLFIGMGWVMSDIPSFGWLFPTIGVLSLFVATSFHYLEVKDQGESLLIRFGPLGLFRRTVPYHELQSIESGRTLLLDGLGIHYSVRGGWVMNIWGRDCVVLRYQDGRTLRVGTNDPKNLTQFLQHRITEGNR